jgi:hypothetical protein
MGSSRGGVAAVKLFIETNERLKVNKNKNKKSHLFFMFIFLKEYGK